jgi:hypothetical protein
MNMSEVKEWRIEVTAEHIVYATNEADAFRATSDENVVNIVNATVLEVIEDE